MTPAQIIQRLTLDNAARHKRQQRILAKYHEFSLPYLVDRVNGEIRLRRNVFAEEILKSYARLNLSRKLHP